MAKKLGRNDPCGCGSGLKYKNCCLKKGIKYVHIEEALSLADIDIKKFFNQFYNYDLAAYFGSTSLNPRNHGKNVRLDYLILAALIYGSPDPSKSLNYEKIDKYVHIAFPRHHYEDPIEHFFTRNICFQNGNAIVYEGIFTYGANILQNLIISLNRFKNSIDSEFMSIIKPKTDFILEISSLIAYRCKHKKNIYLDWNNIPNEIEFDFEYKNPGIVFFNNEQIKRCFELFNTNFEDIRDFCLNISQIERKSVFIENNNKNPLLSKPILYCDRGLYVVSPTTLLSSLVHAIWLTAQKHDLLESLLSNMHQHSLTELDHRLRQLGYSPLESKRNDITLPDYLMYEFDADKCLIIICKYDLGQDYKPETICSEDNYFDAEFTDEELVGILNENKNAIGNKHIQTFCIVFSIGRNISMLSEIDGYNMVGQYFDIMAILHSDIDSALDLWYYNKAEVQFSVTTQFAPGNSTLDRFSRYYKNRSFYINDNKKPSFLQIITDGNFEVIKHGILKNDHLNALYNSNLFPIPVYINVQKYNDYIVRYYNRGEIANRLEFYISNWPFSLWVKNDRSTIEIHNNIKNAYWEFNEAICFWLYEIGPSIHQLFTNIKLKTSLVFDILINIIDDYSPIDFMREEGLSLASFDLIEKEFKIEFIDNGFVISIPKSFSLLCIEKNNDADRLLISVLLNGLHKYFSNQNITIDANKFSEIIDLHAPKGLKKYLLIMSSDDNFSFDNRFIDLKLITYFSKENYELVHDTLIPLLGEKCPPKGEILDKSNKLTLCKNVTLLLAKELSHYLKNYNSYDLLSQLMKRYEATLHDVELYRYRISTLVECYQEKWKIRDEIQKKLRLKDKSTLLLRCLIEYVASENTLGEQNVTQEVIDDLGSLMSTLIFYGSFHDIIEADLFETKLWVLESGRIGTNNKDIEEKFTDRFYQYKSNKTIQESTEYYYEEDVKSINKLSDDQYNKLSSAFYIDYNVSHENLRSILNYLLIYPFENEVCFVDIEINSLIEIIYSEFKNTISKESILAAIEFLSLENRNGMLKNLPNDYDQSDIFPWKFNRRLSYLYKPLVKYCNTNGETKVLYTPRHLEKSSSYLGSKLLNGQFKCNDKSQVKKVIGELSQIKGRALQQSIVNYFRQIEHLNVKEEFKIGEDKKFLEGVDLGDIDVVIIDADNKVVLCIESKKTEESRNMLEFEGEVEDYLSKNGYIFKHQRRHEWATLNVQKIGQRYGLNTNDYRVLSGMITKDKLAIQFMSDREIGLPIYTLKDFEGMGINEVYECFK